MSTIWIVHAYAAKHLGPVVQSVVSLTSSFRVISLPVLTDLIHNILIFFAEKKVSNLCDSLNIDCLCAVGAIAVIVMDRDHYVSEAEKQLTRRLDFQ